MPWLAEQFNSGVVDALLRLGTLAGEAQGVIDALAGELAERCTVDEAGGAVFLDAARLASQPPYLLREVLMAVWRRQGWPMQAMGFAQWDLLAKMLVEGGWAAAESPSKQTLPGNVLAEAIPRGCGWSDWAACKGDFSERRGNLPLRPHLDTLEKHAYDERQRRLLLSATE